MIETGQVWATGDRRVKVLRAQGSRVIVRDSYGWRRSLTETELTSGFRVVGDQAQTAVPGVMACRALADIEPA